MTTLSLSVADTSLYLAINDRDDLLKQCLAAELPVARSCRNGNCGRCDCQLESGEVVLRNGSKLRAPATIALCISHARSDLQIKQLPLTNIVQHWRCQALNPTQLQLPAGRQVPPKPGDIVALLLANTVLINCVAAMTGRVITLRDASDQIEQHKHHRRSIGLLNIDSQHDGDFALWRCEQHKQTLLWQGINQATGLAALAAYRRFSMDGDYQLRGSTPD